MYILGAVCGTCSSCATMLHCVRKTVIAVQKGSFKNLAHLWPSHYRVFQLRSASKVVYGIVLLLLWLWLPIRLSTSHATVAHCSMFSVICCAHMQTYVEHIYTYNISVSIFVFDRPLNVTKRGVPLVQVDWTKNDYQNQQWKLSLLQEWRICDNRYVCNDISRMIITGSHR